MTALHPEAIRRGKFRLHGALWFAALALLLNAFLVVSGLGEYLYGGPLSVIPAGDRGAALPSRCTPG